MIRIKAGKILACAVLAGATLVQAAASADLPVSVSAGFEFASGKYGTGTRTESIFIPFIIGYEPTGKVDFSLEIPWVYQSNANIVAGQYRGRRMADLQKSMSAMTGRGLGSPTGISAAVDPSRAQSGLGDITLRAGYVLIEEDDVIPQFRPNIFIKFPTADEAKGLGTGEFEEGLALEVSKWLGEWYLVMEAGYTFQGRSDVIGLKDCVSFSGGAGYRFSDDVGSILLIKGSTPPEEGSSDLLEARLKLKYRTTRTTGLEAYLAKGITTYSPDFGTGVSVYYNF